MSSPDGRNGARHAATSDEATTAQPATVALQVPARAEYVPILRAACGQVAPLLGCTFEEIADLKLAVDEASGFLLRNCVALRRGTKHDDLSATVTIAETGMHIALSIAADASVAPDGDDFGWAILTALVDDFSWCVQDSVVRVDIRKHRVGGRRDGDSR